ncbi:PTS transporter subunit EIIC [Microbacterium arborescens]|uniref:PTS transporter subunit EIIC n=1 Tax=Microbacterium TaxID=33882 RepID=UPI0025A2033C|nr:PTS transporter subunit EIIC [Microbacterium arborescens]MDF2580483.1 tagatose transporter subunit [Microbacterium sp.]WJM15547.1 PTS transporter subunit EIIC [Microbacterium arborescens]
MDYPELSEEILPLVGGSRNIASYTNCMTRLRLNLHDPSKADVAALRRLTGVMGVVDGPQLQVVVGPGHAQRLRDAFAEVVDAPAEAPVDDPDDEVADIAAAAAGSRATGARASGGGEPVDAVTDLRTLQQENTQKVKSRHTSRVHGLFRHIANIFVPIIPGFIACGLVVAIGNIWKLIDPGVAANPWFLVFAALGTIVVASLNLIVGLNTAKEFGGTPVLGLIAGAISYLPALAGIAATTAADGTVTPAQPLVLPLFGELKPALGGIIGVMVTAWLFTVIEKWIRKRVPAWADLFVVPVVTLLVGAVICIFVIMPISGLLMQGINWLLIDFALERGGVIGGYLLSSLFLPLVMLGIHQGLTPIHAQLITDHGFTELLPVLAMAGAGEVGMAIAIFLKTKSTRLKNIIRAALPIGVLGVGEPLIYGVSLPLFYPLITACLGGGFGGAFVAFGIQASGGFGAGALGLSGVLMTAVITNGAWLWYVGGLVISYIMGFVLTWFFGFKEHMVERLG